MAATHVEFAFDIAGTTCPDCSRDTVRETILVNRHRLVLARGVSCAHCSHQRHSGNHRTTTATTAAAAA
jgi:Zn ribbon nucleic-acid-binding protein